jgi:hypothetical protein
MAGQVAAPVASQPAPAAQPAAAHQATPTPIHEAARNMLLGGFPDPSSVASVDALLDLGEAAAALVSRFVSHTTPPEERKS